MEAIFLRKSSRVFPTPGQSCRSCAIMLRAHSSSLKTKLVYAGSEASTCTASEASTSCVRGTRKSGRSTALSNWSALIVWCGAPAAVARGSTPLPP
eukprot:3809759-Rhodomonas_salina.2